MSPAADGTRMTGVSVQCLVKVRMWYGLYDITLVMFFVVVVGLFFSL